DLIELNTQNHPAAWTQADVKDPQQWTISFTDAECDQIITLAKALAQQDLPTQEIAPNLFDSQTGTLHQTLKSAADQVLNGRGFVFFRGIPPDSLDLREAAYGYAEIGRYLGGMQAQNPQGDVLGKVTNQSKDWKADPSVRGYQN